jgi:hypothetical protein
VADSDDDKVYTVVITSEVADTSDAGTASWAAGEITGWLT